MVECHCLICGVSVPEGRICDVCKENIRVAVEEEEDSNDSFG